MVDLLADNPVLLLFVVLAIGGLVGTIRIRGVSLGPAAALFVGLAISALDEDLALPAALQGVGLALFTYTVGLASGPTFVAGLRRGGPRMVVSVVGLVVALAAVVSLVGIPLDFDAGERSGLFAGAGTNTPALQAAIESLQNDGDTATTDPVVGYSLAYPFGVLMMILAAQVLLRQRQREGGPDAPVSWTVEITRPGLPPLDALRTWDGQQVAFGRVEHLGQTDLATPAVQLQPGDRVTVFGPGPAVDTFTQHCGRRSERHLALDRRRFDFRRIVVSDRALAGKRLGELDLEERFGATVTRIRRGDLDLAATETMRLHLGDRVRVVGPPERLPEVAVFLGDSERSLAEVDVIGLAVGVTLGLLLGLVAVPLPGGGELELGVGGGPLVAGLVLGARSRTGGAVWELPMSANLLIRQLGILIFLACVGTRSGGTFADALGTRRGLELLGAAAVVTLVVSALAVVVVRRVLDAGPTEGSGQLAGFQTQPAVLGFANERTNGDERVTNGYALVFPIAMILKIVVVQLLV